MEVYSAILASDEGIKAQSKQYAYVYNIVKKFIDENGLDQRKVGSTLTYWLNIICNEEDARVTNGYYFETKVTKDLCDHITRNILWRFENSIEELANNECKLVLERGI